MTLRHQAWKFSPDAVVLAVCTGNDISNDSVELEDNQCQPFFTYRDGELVLTGPFEQSAWFRFQCMVRYESRRSAALNLLGDLHRAVLAADAQSRPGTSPAAQPARNPASLTRPTRRQRSASGRRLGT